MGPKETPNFVNLTFAHTPNIYSIQIIFTLNICWTQKYDFGKHLLWADKFLDPTFLGQLILCLGTAH